MSVFTSKGNGRKTGYWQDPPQDHLSLLIRPIKLPQLKALWKKKKEPWLWILAEGSFVHEVDSFALDQFQEIALQDAEGILVHYL